MKPTTGRISVFTGRIAILLDISAFLPLVGGLLCVLWYQPHTAEFCNTRYSVFFAQLLNPSFGNAPLFCRFWGRDIFKHFAKGYIESAKHFLTPLEIELLPYAVTLFPYMQAVRFLADYINGDTYYQTKYEGHNLVRTKAQYKLYLEAKAAVPEMKAYIAGLL